MAREPAVDGARSTRCPVCRAGLRAGAPWCTQCYLDLRTPAATPVSERAPEQVSEPLPVPVLAPAAAAPAAGWPCACGTHHDLAQDACATCGTRLFDVLRGSAEPALVLPVLGDVAGVSKVQLGVAAGVALAVLLVVLLAVLGLGGALLT